MEHYANIINSKMRRIDELLSHLHNEILTTTEHVLQLKRNASTVVEKFRSTQMNQPAGFLQEFLNVNSFLLKSVSFLTEINCKFEMFDLSEIPINNHNMNSRAVTSAAVSEISEDEKNNLGCVSVEDLTLSKQNDTLKEVISKKPSELVDMNTLTVVKTKKKKKKKLKKSQEQKCENQCNNTGESQMLIISNGSRVESKATSSYITLTDSKTYSDAKDLSSYNRLDTKLNGFKNTQLLDSDIILESISFKESFMKIDTVSGVPISKSRKNSTSDKISSKMYSSCDSSELENVTPKSSDLDADKSCNSTSGSRSDHHHYDDIKPPSINREIGKEYDVSIEHIKSPSEFYVSIPDLQTDLLVELEEKLRLIPVNRISRYNKKDENKKAALIKEIGSYALVYLICDEMWCRAKIINWNLNSHEDFVKVFLLDYGESKCVSIHHLKPMPEFFKKYPAFTIRCHLYDVFPVEMDPNSKTLSWEKESNEKMKSLTEYSKKVKIKVAPDDPFHPSTSLPVTLWLSDEDNKCVNKLLVDNKCAIHRLNNNSVLDSDGSKNLNVENESLHHWNPMKEDFDSYQNSYDLDPDDPSAVIYGYVGRDDKWICKHYAQTGYCFKGAACRKEHVKFDPLGFTMDKENVYKNAFNDLSVPPPESVLNVQVTHVVDCNKFFCFPSDQCLRSSEENLISLLQFMNRTQNVRQMKKLLVPPSTGQIVIARYSGDEAWYRARILQSEPEMDEYSVVFVDYGNKETLPLSEIRAIEGRYLHLPFQAMQCFISGIERNPKIPFEEIMDYVKEKMCKNQVSIEVIRHLPGESVNLVVHAFGENGESIGNDLIARGYALSKEENLINSVSELVPG